MGGDDLENLPGGLAVKWHANSSLLLGRSAETVQRQRVSGVAERAERLSIAQHKFGEAAAIGQGGQFHLVVADRDRYGRRPRRRLRSAAYRRIRLAETIP